MKASFILCTGWWCDNNDSNDRAKKYGDESLRKVDFFNEWYRSVNKFISPSHIIVVDSASPVKPDISKLENVRWITLKQNFGHSTQHVGKYSGVMHSFFTSLKEVENSDADYWVYLEQDALVKGVDIINFAISKMRKPMMFGSGIKTPQPVQQSLMIVKKSYISKFVSHLQTIKAKDCEISPEMKFAIASNYILRLLPESVYIYVEKNNLFAKFIKKIIFKISNSFVSDYQPLPFGFGRVRPINFTDEYLYFQHASKDELDIYKQNI